MLVIVGGHSRNIGKTSVVAGLIRAIPEARWTAVKITQHGHGICSVAGQPCECAVWCDAPYAISEEKDPRSGADSARFLAAGARRAYWLRTAAGQLGRAVPALKRIVAASRNAIFESNSAMQFFRPNLYLVVLDYAVRDFKDSSFQFIERADALIVVDRGAAPPPWTHIRQSLLEGRPRFVVTPPDYVSSELVEFTRGRLRTAQAAGSVMVSVRP